MDQTWGLIWKEKSKWLSFLTEQLWKEVCIYWDGKEQVGGGRRKIRSYWFNDYENQTDFLMSSSNLLWPNNEYHLDRLEKKTKQLNILVKWAKYKTCLKTLNLGVPGSPVGFRLHFPMKGVQSLSGSSVGSVPGQETMIPHALCWGPLMDQNLVVRSRW